MVLNFPAMRITFLFLLAAIIYSCSGDTPTNNKATVTVKGDPPFPKGDRAPEQNFTGVVWLNNLVANDSLYDCMVANVTFEPGARTKWHQHPAGQILLVTAGEGYLQEKGGALQTIKKGDVIKCMPGVEHWHGATPTTSLTHIVIMTNTHKGIVTWRQAVTEQEYPKN